MSVAVLLHPYTAAAGADTTSLGQASLRHTLGVLQGLGTPVLSILPEGQLFQLSEALRQYGRPADALLHPGRLPPTAGLALAALHLLGQERDPLILVCQPPLRLIDREHLQQLMAQAQTPADGGAIVSLATLAPLRGQPAARYQLLTEGPTANGCRRVLQVDMGGESCETPTHQRRYHATGAYVALASTFLNALALHAPKTLNACREAMSQSRYGKTRLAPPMGHSGRNSVCDLHCTWPAPHTLAATSGGEIEHQLLLHYKPQVVLCSDDSWLPPQTPIELAPSPLRLSGAFARLRQQA